MRRSRAELTAEQVAAGRRMRQEHGTSWYRIGRDLGCDPETIQRALDPQFDERRRAANAKRMLARAERGVRLTSLDGQKFAEPKRKATTASKRPKAERRDYQTNIEEAAAQRRTIRQDKAFIHAMTVAVRLRQEACPIGVDKRPGTQDPRTSLRPDVQRTVIGSSAQMCADFA